MPRGEPLKTPVRLNEDQVRDIRKRLHKGELQKDLAKEYNVSLSVMSQIKLYQGRFAA